MMFRQEMSREGSARLKVAGTPTAYIFLAMAGVGDLPVEMQADGDHFGRGSRPGR